MIVTVTPNPGLDLTYLLPAGTGLDDPGTEVHRAVSVHLEASGKGVNVARALGRAGRPTVAVFPAGGSTGQHLTELLEAAGVPCRSVPTGGATRINTTVLTPGRATTKVNAPGTGPTPGEIDNLVSAVDDELTTLRNQMKDVDHWLLICGSMPPGVEAGPLIARLVSRARAHGVRVAVDSSGAGLAAAIEAGADLLAPNAAELDAVRPPVPAGADQRGTPDTSTSRWRTAAFAAGLAREQGCELLVSLGADGALWTDGTLLAHARGPVVVPVNTAGAGDALLAGWFAASDPVQGDDASPAARLATAVTWGTAACLSVTTVAGTTPPADDSVQVTVRDAPGAPGALDRTDRLEPPP